MNDIAQILIQDLGLPLSLFVCILVVMWVQKTFISSKEFNTYKEASDKLSRTNIKNIESSLAEIKESIRMMSELIMGKAM